jgi:hypothetical protein
LAASDDDEDGFHLADEPDSAFLVWTQLGFLDFQLLVDLLFLLILIRLLIPRLVLVIFHRALGRLMEHDDAGVGHPGDEFGVIVIVHDLAECEVLIWELVELVDFEGTALGIVDVYWDELEHPLHKS